MPGSRYHASTRAKAIRLVREYAGDYPTQWAGDQRSPGPAGMSAESSPLRLAELVVPAAELDGAVAGLTAALLATDAAAARATTRLLTQAGAPTLEQQATAERAAQAACCGRGSAALVRP